MGTAGSVGLLRDRITDTCVVGSGDAVASFDVASLLKAHRSSGAKVTMALWEVDDPSEFGIVGLSESKTGRSTVRYAEATFANFWRNQAPERPSAT